MKYRCMTAAALLCAAAPLQAPAQFSGGTGTPPPEATDSVIIRCGDCGTIQSIRERQAPRGPDVPNVGGGAPVGLVVYIPLGAGAKSEGKPFVGAVGSKEWQNLTIRTSYEFTVRMDGGDFRFVQKEGVSDLQVGDRVRLNGGRIERMGR